MRDHRLMPPVGICLLALLATLLLAGTTGVAAPAAASAAQTTATAPLAQSAAKKHAKARQKARKRARHARVCRRAHRRAAISAFAHARAARCDRQARRAKHRRTVAKRRAAQRRAAAAPTQQNATAPAPTPVFTATSAARGSTQGYNGFGPGSWPGADWRPYAASSPFNTAVDGSAIHPRSAQIVQKVLSWGGEPANLIAGSADSSSDYAHPTYYAQPDDPIFTLHATQSRNAIEGTRIRIPDAAKAAGGGDGHMTVVTPDGWEYDFWQIQSKPKGGGTLTFSIGGRVRVDGDGLRAPATASNFGNLAGIIRAQELAAGHIDHALFIVVKCTTTTTSFGYGTTAPSGDPAYVYPATHAGSSCGGSDNADAPPMGARFKLDMTDAQIDALAVPAWKKTIARALAHYGGYVGDTGGQGFALQFESSTMYTVFGVADPLVAFAKANGISSNGGFYAFNLASGIDWQQYLRVVVPPGH